MASAFMRHGGARGAEALKTVDVLKARTNRFENEKNVTKNAPVPKKSLAWSGGSITSNKEAALKKFLARKAAKGQAVDPALLQKAMEARGERAEVAVDDASKKSNDAAVEARKNANAARARSDAAKLAPSSFPSQQKRQHQNQPIPKAAKKNAKRNAKKGGLAAEIHASLFR
jgi:phosphoribosylformimino-5-aminoimidazole carboxamide ribonucleotide (ProFAR) isomerase